MKQLKKNIFSVKKYKASSGEMFVFLRFPACITYCMLLNVAHDALQGAVGYTASLEKVRVEKQINTKTTRKQLRQSYIVCLHNAYSNPVRNHVNISFTFVLPQFVI